MERDAFAECSSFCSSSLRADAMKRIGSFFHASLKISFHSQSFRFARYYMTWMIFKLAELELSALHMKMN